MPNTEQPIDPLGEEASRTIACALSVANIEAIDAVASTGDFRTLLTMVAALREQAFVQRQTGLQAEVQKTYDEHCANLERESPMAFFTQNPTPRNDELPDEPPCPIVDTNRSQGHGEIALAISKKDLDWVRDQLLLATDPFMACLRILGALEGQAAAQHAAGYTEALQKTSDVFLTRLALLDSMPPDSSEH